MRQAPGPQLVWQLNEGGAVRRPDTLAGEEPLEIRCQAAASDHEGGRRPTKTLTVTMRTPGNDFELAAGWLNAEGIVSGPDEILALRYCTDPDVEGEQRYNIVTADLTQAAVDGAVPRTRLTSSSCGICGSASIEAVQLQGHPPLTDGPVLDWQGLSELPERLRAAQSHFSKTGGLHGAAVLAPDGSVIVAREDIGRHNAVDKVVGWALMNGRFPLSGNALVVSGRSSFEIVQKALRAGIGLVAGVSAASSLAVELATAEGVTLVGWLRGDRATVYCHPKRISQIATPSTSTATPEVPAGG